MVASKLHLPWVGYLVLGVNFRDSNIQVCDSFCYTLRVLLSAC